MPHLEDRAFTVSLEAIRDGAFAEVIKEMLTWNDRMRYPGCSE